ncbi:hypothetical protein IV102_30300 [bacterium]|nr:hypothetical protein [bacterium]
MLCLLLTSNLAARERLINLLIPLPQGKLPPPWTHTIHISLADTDNSVADHKFYKKGANEFRAVLKGALPNDQCDVEVMCLSKGEKNIAVFRQRVRIKKDTKKLVLDKLLFVETIKVP